MGWDWLPREPSRQERRVAAPEARPHRSRKDRRRWCGGHAGREHAPVVRLSTLAVSWEKARTPKRCGWYPRYRWLRADERTPADAIERPGGRYTVIDRYVWSCHHERGCDRCGKILEPGLGRQCPDYHERETP